MSGGHHFSPRLRSWGVDMLGSIQCLALTCVPAHARGDDPKEEGLVRVIRRKGDLHLDMILTFHGIQNLQ